MKFEVSRDPSLGPRLLWPFHSQETLPCPVKGRDTTYHFLARNALFHGLRVLGLKSGDKVLLPAFHCRTVVEPVIRFGCEVVFYNVHRNGIIDFEDIAKKIDRRTRAIVAIHYFGILQPVRRLQAFCQQHHLFLIEDCAHILVGDIEGEPIGSFGDVSIFSWRKFLPVYDGGLLVRNNVSCQAAPISLKKLDNWFQVKIIKNLLEKLLIDMRSSGKQHSLYTHRLQVPPESSTKQKEQDNHCSQANVHADEFDYSQVNWPMSRWSKVILNRVDLPLVIQKRKANTKVLWDAMNTIPDVQPWSSVHEPSTCAWAFPMVAATRQDIHVKLREKGIQAFSWSGVIHPFLPIEKFPEAKFLYHHLVLLPNQQSLTRHDINLVIQGVNEVLQCQSSHQQMVLQ